MSSSTVGFSPRVSRGNSGTDSEGCCQRLAERGSHRCLSPNFRRAVLCLAVLLLAAAVPSTGASLSAPKDYRRIISFSPAVTEIIYRLGAQDHLAGIASFSDYPPEAAKEKPIVGGILNIDSEKILSLAPDLIISPPGAVANEKLPSFGADCQFLPDKTLADVESSFATIGRLVGKPAEGRALSDALASAVASAKAHNASRPRVRTLVVIGYEPMWVAGGYGVVNELLDAAGGTNVAGNVTKDFYAVDFETVLATAPDCIIDLTLDAPLTSARRDAIRAFWKRFPSIPAVASGRIEFVDSDLLTIPGPRLVDGLAQLEAALRQTPAPAAPSPSTDSQLEGGRRDAR
jgi:ABC-type Fe3+-hydroxamate transport system substrate-binding protein